MSYTLHVAKVHRIEYGKEFFNHESNAVNRFLYDLFRETMEPWGFFYDCEDVVYSSHLEIWKGAWDKMTGIIEDKKDGEVIFKSDDGYAYTKEEVLRFMRDIINNADPDNDTIHLYWF